MRLRELISPVCSMTVTGDADPEITGITCDSRKVAPGFLFAALPGQLRDGACFVSDAVANGAAVVLTSREISDVDCQQVVVADARQALAEMSALFFGRPSDRLQLVGITGTNGKTTVAYGLRHVLQEAGISVGMLGTIEYDTGRTVRPAPLTTPESIDFSHCLSEMVDAGTSVAVVEVSSHALSQFRVAGHRFAGAVFTNLSRDHLDYHRDMEGYSAAKKLLFDALSPQAWAVVNRDCSYASRVTGDCSAEIIGYGQGETAQVRGKILSVDLSGMQVAMSMGTQEACISLPLVGAYNMENALAILAASTRFGVAWDDALAWLSGFTGAPGRLQRITSDDGLVAFVDYAHTDDALRKVLQVLRPLTPGRLITVFGCGGDRDRGKRPLMARAAEELSDRVIVTNDNPRTEPPEQIVADIRQGFSKACAAEVILDREQAVGEAVAGASAMDVVLVAGKGHERYQIMGTEKHHLDDCELVRAAFGLRETTPRQAG